MAEVYKARVLSAQGVERTLVIKKILPEYAANHHFVRMLVADARVSSLLNHPNIVQIFELGEIDAQHYIAMEYVPGPDLLAILTAATHANLRVPLGLALYIISEICNGLHYAHNAEDLQGRPLNLIHRDISPSNILISNEGAVKLMDFGVASADLARSGRERALENPSGTLKGKLGYMAPEQVTSQPVDHRADIFALGIVLFETLTLKRLFLGSSDPETLKNIKGANLEEKFARHPYIPEGVQAILMRALDKDPNKRYPDAGAFREALLTYLFEQRLRVTHRTLSRFINDLDWESTHRLRSSEGPQHARRDLTSATVSDDAVPRGLPAITEASFSISTLVDGPIQGISYEGMQSLIHRQALGPEEEVGVANDAPVTLTHLRARHNFGAMHPSADDQPPIRQGPCNRLMVAELICQMAQANAPLTLHVCKGPQAKMFTVRRGKITSADSTAREERLGYMLMTQGLITADELAESMIASAERGSRLGDTLIAQGRVTPHNLVTVLQMQLEARVSELMTWRQGWYALYDGVAPNGGPALQGIDALELLASVSRRTWTLTELESLFEGHMNREITTTSEGAAGAYSIPLTPQESRLASGIVTGVTLHHLVDSLEHQERLATLRIVMLRHRAGLLSFGATRQRSQGAP